MEVILPSREEILQMGHISKCDVNMLLHSLHKTASSNNPIRRRQFLIVLKSQCPHGYVSWKEGQERKDKDLQMDSVESKVLCRTDEEADEEKKVEDPRTTYLSLHMNENRCMYCKVLMQYNQVENSLICPACNRSTPAKYIDTNTFIRPRSRNISVREYRRISPMIKFVTQFHEDCPPRPDSLINLIWSHLYTFRHSTSTSHVRIVHIRSILRRIGKNKQIPFAHRIALQMIMPNNEIPLMSPRISSELIAYLERHPKKENMQDHFLGALRNIGYKTLADKFHSALDYIRQRNVSVYYNKRTSRGDYRRNTKRKSGKLRSDWRPSKHHKSTCVFKNDICSLNKK